MENYSLIRVVLTLLLACGHVGGLAAATRDRAGFTRYSSEELPLKQADRAYIATIEHRALVLNSKALPVWAKALGEQDVDTLKLFLSKDFTGKLPVPSATNAMPHEAIQIRRSLLDPGGGARIVDGATFVDELLSWRKPYGKPVKVKMALMSLSPSERTDLDKASWTGNLLLNLRGPRTGGGQGELWATIEFDLAQIPDLEVICEVGRWIQSARVLSVQESVARKPLFVEVAKERGIDTTKFTDTWTIFPAEQRPIVTGGIYIADINNDSLEDILVTDVKGVFLFQGLPNGQFKDVSSILGLPASVRSVLNAAFADFDNDGYVDLLLDFRAFKNIDGRRFQDVSRQAGFRFGNATGFTVADYDKDGRLDLYVTRYFGARMPRSSKNSWIDGPGGPGNQLWRNLGNWKFEEVAKTAGATAGRRSCFTAAWFDADNDTWPDAYVINEFGGGVLLRNNQDGTFTEQPLLDDIGDFGSMGLAVADYNNDGWVDVYAANMFSKSGRRVMENLPEGSYEPAVFAKMKRFVTGSEMYANRGGLEFDRVGKGLGVHRVGWAYGPGFLDLDNDGFLDLYGTAGFTSVNRDEPDG